jgi:uncharacterized protein YdaU (DUF1376 family)
MTDAQLALASALSASVLTAIGTRLVAGFEKKKEAEQRRLDRESQAEQARLADARNLRDQRIQRVSRAYEDVSYAAAEIREASLQLDVVWEGDTQENVIQAVHERFNEANRDLGRAIHRLRLEGEEGLVKDYRKLRDLWRKYDYEYAEFLADLSGHGLEPFAGALMLVAARREIRAASDAILDATKARLADLEKPI